MLNIRDSFRFKSARCPHCDESLAADSINIQEGVALCPQCGSLSPLSELVLSDRSIAQWIEDPPPGCSVTYDDRQIKVECSLRSWLQAAPIAIFALFWNGIISLFAAQALAGLYANLWGPLPAWFPAPGIRNGIPEMNDGPMDLRMTLFLCLFLVPFVVIGCSSIVIMLTNLMGTTTVVIDEFESWLGTGIGPFRWKRKFDPQQVSDVKVVSEPRGSRGSTETRVHLIADRDLRFGAMMNDRQVAWFRSQLHQLFFDEGSESGRPQVKNLIWRRPLTRQTP